VRIAHLSDLHLLALDGAVPFRLFNKRLTGYVNIRFHRRSVHRPLAVHAAAREIRRIGVDHVVITGDVSNLALEREFDLVRDFLEQSLGLPADQVSVVPGNHDVYTSGSYRSGRFRRYLAPFMTSDVSLGPDAGAFPFVRIRGPVALIGLSTAVPRPPLVASGSLGRPQLDALARLLEHPEVAKRTPIVLQHHPLHNPTGRAKTLLEGLDDADAEGRVLAGSARPGLVLHGHLHRRIQRRLRTRRGHFDAVGATSASLYDARHERMAGFNLYDVDDDGVIASIGSQRLDASDESFQATEIPHGAATSHE
jgi:3',5'-cyclic AMP phosphodiesterase CpdA